MHNMLSRSVEETIEEGSRFAARLEGGEIFGLVGDLGSGKTTFVKGLAEGLKVAETITSPTFVILKVYPGKIDDRKIEFVHVDAYRAENIADIKSVGIEDYFDRDDVVVVMEWAEKIREILPKKTKYIYFEHLNKEQRNIELK